MKTFALMLIPLLLLGGACLPGVYGAGPNVESMVQSQPAIRPLLEEISKDRDPEETQLSATREALAWAVLRAVQPDGRKALALIEEFQKNLDKGSRQRLEHFKGYQAAEKL